MNEPRSGAGSAAPSGEAATRSAAPSGEATAAGSVPRRTAGVIGLGQIGAGVAASLHRAGWAVVGCDVFPAAAARLPEGARFASSPEELAERSDVVLVAVLDDAQVRDVLTGASGVLGAEHPARAVAVLSTINVATLEEVAAAGHLRGVGIVDCGVSGGVRAAREGTLVAMLGGDDAAVAAVRDAVDAFSSHAVHVGALGAGLRVKLARNLVTYGSWLVAHEAARLVEASGIDARRLAEVIRASDPMTGGVTALIGQEPSERPAPDALSAIAHKDLGAALATAAELGLDLPATRLTDQRFDELLGLVRE